MDKMSCPGPGCQTQFELEENAVKDVTPIQLDYMKGSGLGFSVQVYRCPNCTQIVAINTIENNVDQFCLPEYLVR